MRNRFSIAILLLVGFAVLLFAVSQYSRWRAETLKGQYAKVQVAKWDDATDVKKIEVIQKSVELIHNLALILLGGGFFLALRKTKLTPPLHAFLFAALFAGSVTLLAFCIVSGLSTLSALALSLEKRSPPMTDWRVQGYWTIQIELAVMGAVGVLLVFVQAAARQWTGREATTTTPEGQGDAKSGR